MLEHCTSIFQRNTLSEIDNESEAMDSYYHESNESTSNGLDHCFACVPTSKKRSFPFSSRPSAQDAVPDRKCTARKALSHAEKMDRFVNEFNSNNNNGFNSYSDRVPAMELRNVSFPSPPPAYDAMYTRGGQFGETSIGNFARESDEYLNKIMNDRNLMFSPFLGDSDSDLDFFASDLDTSDFPVVPIPFDEERRGVSPCPKTSEEEGELLKLLDPLVEERRQRERSYCRPSSFSWDENYQSDSKQTPIDEPPRIIHVNTKSRPHGRHAYRYNDDTTYRKRRRVSQPCFEGHTGHQTKPPPLKTSKAERISQQSPQLALAVAMYKSQLSQKTIMDWDKKMGLPKQHSRTMNKSLDSRSRLYRLFFGSKGVPPQPTSA